MVSLKMNDITSKVEDTFKDLSWLTGSAGFIYGVTYKYRSANAGTSYPFNQRGLVDVTQQLFGNGVAAQIWGQSQVSSVAKQTFNPSAILNKFTAYAVIVWAAHEIMPNKYTRIVKNIALPPLMGAGIGRVFDDPIASSQTLTSSYGSAYPVANYSNTARNGLPVAQTVPWLS